MAMAKVQVELVILLVVAMVVGMSSVGAAAAQTCFPLDCVSYALEGRAVPLKFCCIEVQDQFLLTSSQKIKSSGISDWCKAVTAVQRYNGALAGTELELALAIPHMCNLDSYYKMGFACGGKVIPGGV